MDKTRVYRILSALGALLIAAAIGSAMAGGEPIVAVAVLSAGFLILFMLRERFRILVLKDERTSKIGEKAASTTFWLFIACGGLVIVAGLASRNLGYSVRWLEAGIEPLGTILFGLMLAYSAIHYYYSAKM
jgi:uncharacterized membrane protein